MKGHGGTDVRLKITDNLTLTDLEFADDAALPNEKDGQRVTNFHEKACAHAGMSISVPKTKYQHIRNKSLVYQYQIKKNIVNATL